MYLVKKTNEIVSQGELRKRNPEISLPAIFDAETLEFLGVEAVIELPAPVVSSIEEAYRDGAVKDAEGNWTIKWSVRPIFADIKDESGAVVKTQAQQEADYIKSQNSYKFQAALDAFARERDFDGINDAVSYVDSANEQWKQEAAHAKTMRDQAWEAFYAGQPLPALTWPN
jgi:hypothetical protein